MYKGFALRMPVEGCGGCQQAAILPSALMRGGAGAHMHPAAEHLNRPRPHALPNAHPKPILTGVTAHHNLFTPVKSKTP